MKNEIQIWNEWKPCIDDLGLDACVLNAMSDFAAQFKPNGINTSIVRPALDESDGGELLPAEGMEQGGSDGEPYYCEFCGSDEGGHMYGCPNGKYG